MERKKRSEILLCYPLEERRLTEPKFKWRFPVLTQPKLDGVRCRAVCEGPNVVLLSSTCAIITSVPHINEALGKLCLHIELDGEIYSHGEAFETINSITSRTVNPHENASDVQFHIFDLINDEPQLKRTVTLMSLISSNNPILNIVPCNIAQSFEEILSHYNKYLADGYEGIIVREKSAPYVRKRSTFILKFKPKKSDIYKIIGTTQMIDKDGLPKPLLGALILTSDEGTVFSVGSGMTETFRRTVWGIPQTIVGKFCKISYQHMTAKGSPRFPIFIAILEENPEESETTEGGIL